MGAPGYAVFCSNGHLCKSVMHHEIDFSEVTQCQCGSTRFYTQNEWGDPDYEQYVAIDPIKTDEHGPVFDITKLIEHAKKYREKYGLK